MTNGITENRGAKTLSEENLVDLLTSIELLAVFQRADLSHLANHADSKFFDFGETICSEGEACNGVYIVKSGAVRIFTEEQGKEISGGIRKTGEVFGELAVLREYRYEASLRASAKSELIFIPHSAFATLLQNNPDAKSFVTSYVAVSSAGGFVTRLFNLRGKVDNKEVEELVRSVGVKRLLAGDTVLQQEGREDRRLYIVRQGQVQLTVEDEGDEFVLATLTKGDYFGEKACLMRQPQFASVIAKTDVVLLIIPEATVKFLLERNPKLKDALEERIQFTDRELQRQKKIAERRKRPLLIDLKSKPEKGERLIKRFPLVHQAEEMDCGAACLAMICKNYEINTTLGKLRELANVTTQGATMDSLARVGESLGFVTRGIQCTYESLLGFELPFIAHWEGYHYVVVYGVSKEHVWVADPGPGFKKMTVDVFERGWTGNCLVFSPGTDLAQFSVEKSPWVRFVSYIKPYKKILSYLFMATFVIQIFGLVPPIIIQNILDRVVVHANVSLLNLLISGLVITSLFNQLTSVLRGFLSAYMVRNMDFSMMSGFFKHAMSLPISFFTTRRTGDIFARFQENQTIRAFMTESTISTILNLLMVFIYFTILFMYNVEMTLLLIAFVIPILILTVVVTPTIKKYARESFEAATDAESVLMETIGGVETLKGMGIERSMRLRWERKYTKSLNVQYKAQRFGIFVGFASQIFNSAITIVILWYGANQVLAQQLTIGQLVAFNSLMGSVLSPLMGLVGLWNQVHQAGVAMERLGDVLEIEPEQSPTDLSSRVALPDLHGSIKFEDLYFRYGDSDSPYILEDINFEIEPGSMVAIVGQSGSGKTTLAKLLVGFYPPTEGRIMVDGYDMSVVDKEYYRAQIGYVMQSNLLFTGTISENIAAGEENPDHRKVMEAAKMADAHGFIANMPLGYNQIVGERGMGLSGGQIQRVCIARALYHDPRLLIFDEATSSLDTESESNILSNMQNILEGRTAVVIAHRLSTIMQADKILVLYKGSIIEQGRHDELVEQMGMYYQLVQKQISN